MLDNYQKGRERQTRDWEWGGRRGHRETDKQIERKRDRARQGEIGRDCVCQRERERETKGQG